MCIACGSFRRGKPTCGDVDVLVTHPDGHSHQGVFNKLLNILHKSGMRISAGSVVGVGVQNHIPECIHLENYLKKT